MCVYPAFVCSESTVPLLQRVTFEKRESNQSAFPPPYGSSLWLGLPSLRFCSGGAPRGAVPGPARLTRRPASPPPEQNLRSACWERGLCVIPTLIVPHAPRGNTACDAPRHKSGRGASNEALPRGAWDRLGCGDLEVGAGPRFQEAERRRCGGGTRQDAELAARGQGWPLAAPPEQRLCSGSPSHSEDPYGGERDFWSLLVFLKVTRCKSGTNIPANTDAGYVRKSMS
ncbi:MAG: hypothetical protein JWQ69_5709 [Pseudomonas sp.]|nr:hypothetical protein [Pseudomonas sp.]